MRGAVEASLDLWGLTGATWQLVAERENRVFKVVTDNEAFALRLHRVGYRTDVELRSELKWMKALSHGGLNVPTPVASLSGQFLHVVEGIQIDLLSWLNGRPAGETGKALELSDRVGFFGDLGRALARLHDISDNWIPPAEFQRCHWDRDGLLGDPPLWDRFWLNPTLSSADRALFSQVRNEANDRLARKAQDLDFGLIHADLVRENVLIGPDGLQLIDFDDGGFGFRLFDIATALIKNLSEPDYPQLKSALLQGYLSVRQIDLEELDLFLLLRSASYVGWVISRIDEPGAKERNQRFVETTRKLAQALLENP